APKRGMHLRSYRASPGVGAWGAAKAWNGTASGVNCPMQCPTFVSKVSCHSLLAGLPQTIWREKPLSTIFSCIISFISRNARAANSMHQSDEYAVNVHI